ncbi:hypothetical protein Pla175_42600 [Pirellulimonas nuda]|uniref:Uncharacterized protein n=1 Tax=Pirellulimonas nuda TaxID=2528009 RepID=A0A518DH96_9BACT|nr:hypothetical protein [Pirellulimonas nuda]QDU90847.1 hypothetical protein Pla175_42600 [Pirellulimonas nuda]
MIARRKCNAMCVVGCVVASLVATHAQGDYNWYGIPTVEWLVDNSDIIAIVEHEDADLRVLVALKGDGEAIGSDLRPPETRVSWRIPPKGGKQRVVFVSEGSLLLGEIGIGRPLSMVTKQSMHGSSYGVTQFGRVLLTASELIDAINDRIQASPPVELPESSRTPWRPGPELIEEQGLMVRADIQFPFESTDELFSLLVPRTLEWREHYVQQLRNGDACERIHAIHCLSKLADKRSLDEIDVALSVKDVAPGFRPYWSSSNEKTMLIAEDVQSAAKSALDSVARE